MRDLKTWTGGVEVHLKVRRQFKKKNVNIRGNEKSLNPKILDNFSIN